MGTSLWLMPSTAEMDMIKSGLPRRSPTAHDNMIHSESSYPVIIPHITLATVASQPGIPDILLDAIPDHRQPIRANFQSLAVGDHYFRSVLLDIQPTQELVGIQNQISAHLRSRGFEPRAPRFPHMSLCYIADQDKCDRSRTAEALKDEGIICPADDTGFVSFQCGDVRLQGFDGAEIWVVNCDGPVETWQVGERKVKLALDL